MSLLKTPPLKNPAYATATSQALLRCHNSYEFLKIINPKDNLVFSFNSVQNVRFCVLFCICLIVGCREQTEHGSLPFLLQICVLLNCYDFIFSML